MNLDSVDNKAALHVENAAMLRHTKPQILSVFFKKKKKNPKRYTSIPCYIYSDFPKYIALEVLHLLGIL